MQEWGTTSPLLPEGIGGPTYRVMRPPNSTKLPTSEIGAGSWSGRCSVGGPAPLYCMSVLVLCLGHFITGA